MRRYHWILILAFAVAAAFLLRQGHEIRGREIALAAADTDAGRLSPTQAAPSPQDETTRTKRADRAEKDTFDPRAYVAELDALIASAPADPSDRFLAVMGSLIEHGDELKAASPATLKATCEMIEKSGLDADRMNVWKTLAGLVAKHDPAWAIQQLDRVSKSEDGKDADAGELLDEIDRMGRDNRRNWPPEYAVAFASWLDSAQSSGRLEGLGERVSTVRGNIALTTGDLRGAARQLAGMAPKDRMKLSDGIIRAADSPEARAKLIAQVAGSPAAVAEIARALARKESLGAVRSTLDQAKLSAADRGHAVLGVATAAFGSDTAERAQWLLDSVAPGQSGLVTDFAAGWTRNDFRNAAQWLGTLPEGPVRDAAVSGFVPDAARLDGASAADWALTVADQTRREAMLRQVYETWHAKDPDGSRAYFEGRKIAIPSSETED